MDVTHPAGKSILHKVNRVTAYTALISVLGGVTLILAFIGLPKDLMGLGIFAVLVALAELGSVELFSTGRSSSVSVTSIISIAAVLVLGPLAGVLIQMVGVLINTLVAIRQGREGGGQGNGAPMVRRVAFNLGLFSLSTAAAGEVYLLTGGKIGDLLHASNILPVILATTADTLVNVLLLLVVIYLQTRQPPRIIWKENFQWAVPIMIGGGALGGGALALAYQINGLLGASVFFLPIFAMGYSFRLYTSNLRDYVDKLEGANAELIENNIELLETLGAVIDAYDVYTLRHSALVAEYAGELAATLGLSEAEQKTIVKAALVHDIGKIGISEAIIGKPGKLTEQEYNQMRRHPVLGANILGRMKGFQDLIPMVLYHQEKFDGTGYPEGLKGNAIPLGARIITLADSVEAMCTDRPYRPGYNLEQVIAEVKRCSGTHFDPQIVQAFLILIEQKGEGYFINSAHTVEDAMHLAKNPVGGLRFLKRSLIEQQESQK